MLLFLLLLSISVFSEVLFADGQKSPQIVIVDDVKDVFPAKPVHTAVHKFRFQTRMDRSNSVETSQSESVELHTVEYMKGSQRRVGIVIESLGVTQKKGKDTFKIDGKSVFKNAKLAMNLDCANPDSVKREGFQEALGRIESKIQSKEARAVLADYVNSIAEQVPSQCQKALGPFNESNFFGKTPGSVWEESVPVQGFEGAKLKAKFLGWSRDQGKLFAVLEGRLNAETGTNPSLEAKSSIDVVTYFFVEKNWKTIRRTSTTQFVVSTADGNLSGSTKIEQIINQVN